MMKKFALVFALFLSFTGASFAATNVYDGSEDVVEAMGGSRNGGDC